MLNKKPESKLSIESIFALAKHIIKSDPNKYSSRYYRELEIDDGLTPELIRDICEFKKISCYIFDENDHRFVSYVAKESHYTAIVMYAINSHAYLINDPLTIKCVANTRTNSSEHTKHEEPTENDTLPIVTLDIADLYVTDCLAMESAKYIITNCTNLKDFILSWYATHNQTIKTLCSGNHIIQMEFKNANDKNVVIACDQTPPGTDLEYDNVVQCLADKGITYTNQGIGYVVNKLLASDKARKPIDKSVVDKLIHECRNACSHCCNKLSSYEIDHIIPRSCGGKDTINNLQLLCPACHQKKTAHEKEHDTHNSKVYHSYFNKPVVDNIVNSSYSKTYARVDLLAQAPPEPYVERCVPVVVKKSDPFGVMHNVTEYQNKKVLQKPFKVDMIKCRRNIVLHNKYQWPVFGVFDKPEKFDGVVKCGWYFVRNPKKHMIHRGDGIYGECVVRYMILNNLIS
jgi:hypothetical protein